MKTKKITVAQADEKIRNSGGTTFEHWNALLAHMEKGDEIVEYSDVDV